MKYKKVLLLAIALFLLPVPAYAISDVKNRASVLQYLQDAFEAQVSLSEKERSRKEIEEILIPYFSEDYIDLFLQENLVEIDGKFITYGSDAAIYYIPFFQYSDKTRITEYNKKVYVFEYFPKNDEGPVSYESHYEGVVLEQFGDKWKVSEYLYDNIPEEVIKNNEEKDKEKNQLASFMVFPQNLFNRFIQQDPIDLFMFRFVKVELKNNTIKLPELSETEKEILQF